VAHLGAGVFLQVILVVLLSLPERPRRGDLGHDLSRPEAGCVDVRDGVDGGQSLFFTGVEDGRTNVSPDLIALPVQRRRIVDLKEELEQVPVRKGVGVIGNLQRLGVIAQVVVRGARGFPAGVPDSSRDDPGLATDQLLDTQ
jgi:hypothetical protein